METTQPFTYDQIAALFALSACAASCLCLAASIIVKGLKNAGKSKVIRRHFPADNSIFGRNEPNLVVRDILKEVELTEKIPVSIVIEVHYV